MPGAYREHGPLGEHLRYVERAARRLARAIFAGMARWQGRLEHRQAYLGRIVDIGAEVFAMAASCVRATAERDTHPDGVELAAAFCEQARVRVDALFGALWHNSDRSDRRLARPRCQTCDDVFPVLSRCPGLTWKAGCRRAARLSETGLPFPQCSVS